jgi:hypothetical protein
MNYGPNTMDKIVAADLKLDLKAPSVPVGVSGERLRIRQLYNSDVQMGFLKTHQWVQDNKGKALPPIEPKLDPATGTISGFDINYHDVKFIAVDWEAQPVNDAAWKSLAANDAMRIRLLNWGINGAKPLPAAKLAKLIVPDSPAVKVDAWNRPGDKDGRGNSVLVRVTNPGDQPVTGTIKLDLKGLDLNVRQIWSEFAAAVAMDAQPVENRESAGQKRSAGISYNAYAGELYYNLKKGESRLFSLDRY